MHRTIPLVRGGRLYQSEREGDPIAVGTSAWYDWLENHDSFTFVDRLGTITVHKSGSGTDSDLDWKASHTRMGKLFRVSLGPSRTLTLSRLQAAARTLAGRHTPVESTTMSPAVPVASTLPVTWTEDNVDPPNSLIQTKLYRPRTRSDLIPRARLIERLNAGLSGKVRKRQRAARLRAFAHRCPANRLSRCVSGNGQP
ncbi:MAG: hypothetical protein E6I80_15975 [Chloroflexi bacterium]|nr:MAG: hypothetical protein E6I80_15975 [Chloroflexota bacterium]